MDDSVVLPTKEFSLPLSIKVLKSLGMMLGASVIIILIILIPLIGIPGTLATFGYTVYYVVSTLTKKYIISNEYIGTKSIFGEKTIPFDKVKRLRTVKKNSKGHITQFIFEVKGGDLRYFPYYFDQDVATMIAQKFGKHE